MAKTAELGAYEVDANSGQIEFLLEPDSNEQLANFCGPFDQHLRLIENELRVQVLNRSGAFTLRGPADQLVAIQQLLEDLYRQAGQGPLKSAQVHLAIRELVRSRGDQASQVPEISIRTRRGVVRGRTSNQRRYLQRISENDLNFGIGPAGTGKTYLAVAAAVEALEADRVRRIVLTRPAVEAGERLGFLPGDLAQKIDPYLKPLYDALYEMLGFERVARLIERDVIEVAPLAYMRGRTLNESFIILDEAQNTTAEQMKMFLTRIGFGSKAVVNGDVTQIDLGHSVRSGLRQARDYLRDVPGISFTGFEAQDVVRHPLVQKIIEAYDDAENPSVGQSVDPQS